MHFLDFNGSFRSFCKQKQHFSLSRSLSRSPISSHFLLGFPLPPSPASRLAQLMVPCCVPITIQSEQRQIQTQRILEDNIICGLRKADVHKDNCTSMQRQSQRQSQPGTTNQRCRKDHAWAREGIWTCRQPLICNCSNHPFVKDHWEDIQRQRRSHKMFLFCTFNHYQLWSVITRTVL